MELYGVAFALLVRRLQDASQAGRAQDPASGGLGDIVAFQIRETLVKDILMDVEGRIVNNHLFRVEISARRYIYLRKNRIFAYD